MDGSGPDHRSKDLDTAIKLGAKTIKQHDSDVSTETSGLADTFKDVDASTLPQTLVPLLESLGNAPADDFAGRVRESRRKGVEAVASAKKYWSGLYRRTKNRRVGSVVRIGLGVVGGFVGLFFLTWVVHQIGTDGDTPSTTNGVSGDKQGQHLAAFQTIVAAYEKTGVLREGVDKEVLALWETFDHLADPEQAIAVIKLYDDRLEPAMRKYANAAEYEYLKAMFTEWAAQLNGLGHIKPHHR